MQHKHTTQENSHTSKNEPVNNCIPQETPACARTLKILVSGYEYEFLVGQIADVAIQNVKHLDFYEVEDEYPDHEV